ncbi:hypothetical protein AJ80_05783 [Polytolypa hystricis UAMH7299]|uniref:Uncharacterized protein n=1 Tax=Polytolypa hystricis (strain UAMH7299) TaxID=1447883 RepID=A0A2B7Y2C0_POLH7|nr:hypothetical protein AJ80_05783 [Polytolypa hystricis UAMH7299]
MFNKNGCGAMILQPTLQEQINGNALNHEQRKIGNQSELVVLVPDETLMAGIAPCFHVPCQVLLGAIQQGAGLVGW